MHSKKVNYGKTIRFLSIVLAIVLTFQTAAPTSVLAAEDTAIEEINVEETVNEVVPEEKEEETTEDQTVKDEVVEDETTKDETVEEETTEDGIVEDETTEDEVVEDETIKDETVEETTEDGIVEEETTEEEIVEEETEEAEIELTSLEDEEETVTDYATFLSSLKILEEYAADYAGSHAGEDKIELVINYIRTGVERYLDGSWKILAGEEITEFTSYVKEQDKANGTNAGILKNLDYFTIPNGDQVDFGHMFGCMNITYYMAKTNPTQATIYADLSGWGGDLGDLMEATVDEVEVADIETMITGVREYLAVDDPSSHGFGLDDIYGDLDGYYIMNNLEGGKTISKVMENYFNTNLTDSIRATYFVENRFSGSGTHEEIREAVYNAYSSNSMLKNLEASKGLSNVDELRYACCYAFADYLYELTGNLSEKDVNDLYSVFSTSSQNLAPGVKQEIKYALTADDKQIVYYIATADVTREDVDVYANYNNNDGSSWGRSPVKDQMEAAIVNHTNPDDLDRYIANYNPVVGVNADFFHMVADERNGEPTGALVMEGVKYHDVGSENFFAILKDGTPILGSPSDFAVYEDQIQEAVGGSTWLVKNGQIAVKASGDYYNDRASRTCVGITADNKVVLMVLDGRQEPFSAGGCMAELAQIMYDAGCVNAINLDGGGSTTFVAKEEGSDELEVINNPSDGFVRSVSSSLMVVSTAKPTTEFDHAIVTADYDYMTIGASVTVTATGVTASGGSAELPEGTYLKLSDETIGTLDENGAFTATANGDVQVQVLVGDTVVGKKVLHVVVPDSVQFDKDHITAVYDVPVELPLSATYNGNVVAINKEDAVAILENPAAGTINGIEFIGNEASGIRSVIVYGALLSAEGIIATAQIDLYRADEAIFDFDNATSGDRQFSWKREISNTTSTDEVTYHIVDYDKEVEGSYILALDMKEIPIPEKLLPLVSMLPGGDRADATAWGFLLELAERVSVLTNVEVKFQVDENFDLDYSELTVVNDYFTLTSTDFDEETNTLTIMFNWVDQTAAIDPATANSICILSGLKFTPKEGTADVLTPVMQGTVTYDIYLRASAVYGMAQDPAVQEAYDLYPFVNPDDSSEKGGHFSNTFVEFNDTFTLDRAIKNGWIKDANGNLFYYKDNVICTGINRLPGYQDEENEYYYDLGTDGVSKGKVNGLFKLNGKLYYAVLGELKTGWRSITTDETTNYYYFAPQTAQALDGKQTIDGYTYNFEDCILVRGHLVIDETGLKYMWAGEWAKMVWLEIDGKLSYASRSYYFVTGPYKTYSPEGEWKYYAFDEYGTWLQDQNGLYEYDGATYYTEDGYVISYPGLVAVNNAYYYFDSSDTMVKNCTYWVSKTNGLMSKGNYTFDKQGRLVINGKVVKPATTPETTPEEEQVPETDPGTYGAVVRIYGRTRYQTSLAIADTLKETLNIDKFNTVVIATGDNYPDALSGAYLAAKKDAPILMANQRYADELRAYIRENLEIGGTIYMLGGANVLPDEIIEGLEGYNVKRLAGSSRYDTNLEILKEAEVKDEDILVCTGLEFADSLSASATGKPILLVKNALTDKQKEFLETVQGNKFYIIGSESAVSKSIETSIRAYGATERVGGKNRYETSVLVAEKFFDQPETAVVAYAYNFPDGLCGGPLAMSMGAPLILTKTNAETAAANYMKAYGIKAGAVLGSSSLITDDATRKVFGLDADVSIIEK